MLTFLAQYGREWLQDSNRVRKGPEMENGLLVGNFVHLASLLAFESYANKQEKNRAHTWSRILMTREEYKCYVNDKTSEELQMPFGRTSGKVIETDDKSSDVFPLTLFEVSFKNYESKIKRLIDSLPPGLFEKDDPKGAAIIQNICSLDLENFLLFLQINPVEPLGTIRNRKLTASVVDAGPKNNEITENASMNVITSGYVPRYVTDTNAKTRNSADRKVLLEEKIGSYLSGVPSTWFETEFMLHLENLSAISHWVFNDAARSEQVDWKDYLKHFRVDRSLSRFFETKTYKPNCLSQSYYWGIFYLPCFAPPAIGDPVLKDLKDWYSEAKEAKGARFIGYIMEIVRTRLAKWTASGDVSKLRRCGWTTGIPEEWSMEFRAKSDLSMLCYLFEKQEDVSCIRIPHREDGTWLHENRFMWTCYEQVLWECQQHLLELISDDEREYGPQNVELVLLFLLGLPLLNVWTHHSAAQLQPYFRVIRLEPVVPDSELTVDASLVGKSPNDVHIQMRIRTDRDYSAFESDELLHRKRGFEFCWEDWIHLFEGCMKILTMDFNENDFKKERTVEKLNSGGNNDDEGCRASEDTKTNVETMSSNKSGKSEHVANQDNTKNGVEDRGNGGSESNDKAGEEEIADVAHSITEDDALCVCFSALEKADENANQGNGASALEGARKCEDQIWKKKEEGGDDSESNEHTVVSSESERRGDDGSHPGVGSAELTDYTTSTSIRTRTGSGSVTWDSVARCACEYKLDKRAEKRIIEGTNKYYWHWEGWKPQAAFQKWPLLFALERSDNENGASTEEEDEDVVGSCLQATRGKDAGEAAWNEEKNEEESVLALAHGEEMV
ncbi:hypothetical protein FGB62_84g07 [Gracilaria domingensis]|nr:hypothetical protein FGB62_84g07 [Gracilaria domingensis]